MRNPFRCFNSSPEVIRLTVMMYIRYPCRCGRSRICCSNAASISATKRCGSDGTGSVRCSPRRSASGAFTIYHTRAGGGTWTGVRENQWRDTLFVARRGSRRRGARVLPQAPGSQGCADVSETGDEALWPAGEHRDGPASLGAAMKAIGIVARRECGRWLNNRAENSHQPFRRREGRWRNSVPKDPAEICRRSRLDPQPLSSGPPPQPPRHLQAETLGRSDRVASAGGLRSLGPGHLGTNFALVKPFNSWSMAVRLRGRRLVGHSDADGAHIVGSGRLPQSGRCRRRLQRSRGRARRRRLRLSVRVSRSR